MNSFRPGGYNVMPSLSQRYYRAGKNNPGYDPSRWKEKKILWVQAKPCLGWKIQHPLVILFYWIVPKTSGSGLECIRNSKNWMFSFPEFVWLGKKKKRVNLEGITNLPRACESFHLNARISLQGCAWCVLQTLALSTTYSLIFADMLHFNFPFACSSG